jgi:hypothetical protein
MLRTMLAVILALLITIEALGQQQDAFTYLDERTTSFDQNQSRVFAKLKQQPTTLSAHLVRFDNLPALKESQSMRISLPSLAAATASKRRAETISADQWVWSGSFAGDKGSAFLSATGSDITGVIQFERLLFTIEPLGKGLHVLVLVDQSKIPPDEPPDWNPEPQQQKDGQSESAQNIPSAIESTTTTTTVDVMVVYTPAAAASSGNITSLVNGCIQSTNDGLINSDANPRVNLVHAVQVTYTESGSVQTDVNRLRNTSDGYMDNIHTLRNQYGADVVVLLVDYGDYAGIAYNIGVDSSDAFAVVVDNYAVGNYTFAHEIGHLVGGRHDNDPGTIPSSYGHGYRYNPGYWRTIMAVLDPIVYRINYWSNPRKTYGGVAMGTVDWNDNTRVWNERASIVAGFRTPPPPLSVSISGPTQVSHTQFKGQPANYYSWTANPSGGQSPYTYTWLKDDVQVSTAATYGEYFSWNGYGGGSYQFTLRVDVRDAQNTLASATMVVTAYNSGGGFDPSVQTIGQPLPTDFSLSQNYPNPFNPETEITFALPERSHLRIAISDILGRDILTLHEGELAAGYHSRRWSGVDEAGRKVVSGIYFYRMTAIGESGTQFTKVMKLLLLK